MKDSINILSENRNKTILLVFILIIPILIISRDFFGIPINKFIYVLVCAIAFYFLNYSYMICALTFLLPLLSGLPGNYIIVIAVLILLVHKRLMLKPIQLFFILFIILGETIHLFGITILDIADLIAYFSYIILIIIITLNNKSFFLYKKTIQCFITGIITQLFIILFSTLKFVSINEILTQGLRFGNVSSITTKSTGIILVNNPNNIAYYCVLSIACLLVLIYRNKSNNIGYYLLILISGVFGFLTASRSFIIVTLILLILYISFNLKFSKKNFTQLFSIIIIFIIGYQLFFNQSYNLLDNVFLRFQESDKFGGRSLIFQEYNEYMVNNIDAFLVGTGLFPMLDTVKIISAPHNGLQQLFVAYGLIGFILFIILFSLIIMNAKNKNKISAVYYLPIIVMVTFTQTVQLIAPFELMMPIIIAFCSIRLGSETFD